MTSKNLQYSQKVKDFPRLVSHHQALRIQDLVERLGAPAKQTRKIGRILASGNTFLSPLPPKKVNILNKSTSTVFKGAWMALSVGCQQTN